MGKADYFLPGSYNVQCDRSGFKIKATSARKEWNGLMVRAESWEERHPQDMIRSKRDDQSVPDPRPEEPDYFLSDNEVTTEDL